jgi:hypothetical protein
MNEIIDTKSKVEINFQCSDCGVCFRDNDEGARLAKEHVRLTGHNEDLVSFEIDELLKIALKKIDAMKIIKEEFHN